MLVGISNSLDIFFFFFEVTFLALKCIYLI